MVNILHRMRSRYSSQGTNVLYSFVGGLSIFSSIVMKDRLVMLRWACYSCCFGGARCTHHVQSLACLGRSGDFDGLPLSIDAAV